MTRKSNRNILFLIVVTFLTIVGLYLFIQSEYYSVLNVWIQKNLILYVVFIFIVKILGILWPPLSGGIFTVASIPFVGWKLSFLIDFVGSLTGGTIAYYLGRNYGYKFLNKIFNENIVQKIKGLKIKKGKEIEAIFMYKVLFGIVIEAIYYGAGVLRVNFVKFSIGSILGHLLVGIPTFYLTGNIFSGKDIVVAVVLVLVGVFIVYKTKGRYFE